MRDANCNQLLGFGMKILILGGVGFLGRAILRALGGNELTLFTRGSDATVPAGVHWIRGARQDLPNLRAEISKGRFDVAIDTGAQNRASAELAMTALSGIVPHVVMLSSLSVYQRYGALLRCEKYDSPNNFPLNEEAKLRNHRYVYRTPSGHSRDPARPFLADYDKIPAEEVFTQMAGTHVSILRLPLIYGPDDPDARVQSIARQMRTARSIFVWKSVALWRNSRSYVDNAASAVAAAAVSPVVAAKATEPRIFNVADEPHMTEVDWVTAIATATNWDGTIKIVPDGDERATLPVSDFPTDADFQFDLTVNTAKIRRDLGWRERFTVAKALENIFSQA